MTRIVCLVSVLAALAAPIAATAAAEDASQAPADDPAQALHRQFSASCFNDCWTLIEKRDRSDEDTENMLLLAYASLWHWKQRSDCAPVNLSVGYWLLSRTHALAGYADMAILYGGKCLSVSDRNALPPFYVGYAYEALARATALRGDIDAVKGMLEAARAKQAEITDMTESTLLATDLREIEQAVLRK